MARADISAFDWPEVEGDTTGSTRVPPANLSQSTYASLISGRPLETRASQPVAKTIRATITSTVVQTPESKTYTSSPICQTNPLDRYASRPFSMSESSLPDQVTAVLFKFHTAPVDSTVSTKPISTSHESTPSTLISHLSSTDEHLALPPTATAGTVLGALASISIFIALGVCIYRRRKIVRPGDSEALRAQDVINMKTKRNQDLGRQRWSMQQTLSNKEQFQARNAKIAAATAAAKDDDTNDESKGGPPDSWKGSKEEGADLVPSTFHRARPISGLAMHPPTPTVPEAEEKFDFEIGRAI